MNHQPDGTFTFLFTDIDNTTFAEAQAAGYAMSMDEAITLALESTHD